MIERRSARRMRFNTPVSDAKRAALMRIERWFDWLSPRTRFALGFFALVLATTVILSRPGSDDRLEDYKEGETVLSTVTSPDNIAVEARPGVQFQTLKRHQIVAREGETVTPQMRAQFDAIRNYHHAQRRPLHYLGLFVITLALFWAAWSFTERRTAQANLPLSKQKSFALIGLSVVVQTFFMLVGFKIADSVPMLSVSAPFNDPIALAFAIPFASASLLVSLLLDTELALMTGIMVAVFAGILAPNGVTMTIYALVSSAAAIHGVHRYRDRQAVTLAGLFVGVTNVVTTLALLVFVGSSLSPGALLLAAGCGFTGGLLTIIFTSGGMPINEALFGILTDVKLLELSNADLPILSQLALRAPGTNQHSHAIGQLAEDACRSIGANCLLARIGALYHDIGKLASPEMYVENQNGVNPHEKMKPLESARVIENHVNYGVKLAREIGLPQKIIDFIPQHHGTRPLHFFLKKAQALATGGEVVDESQFRYPGPKPQFKEAAILMLADSCEAAARSLQYPTPTNIREIVNKIFASIISDGQLDECDLTLRELNLIRESLINSLVAIYHHRVNYPGFNPPAENKLAGDGENANGAKPEATTASANGQSANNQISGDKSPAANNGVVSATAADGDTIDKAVAQTVQRDK